MASKYDSIWAALKLRGEVKLAVPPSIQRRVIKAVINLKDQDTCRKIELNIKLKKEKIEYTRDAAMVTMKLITYDNLNAIGIGDL
jgi:hypothetical protein